MPSSGDTLSLNNLAGALGGTQNSAVSLNSLNSSADTQVSLSDYSISAVDNSITGYTYAVEATNETYTMTFADEGSKFGNIKGRNQNFSWAVSPAFNSAGDTSGFLSIAANQDYTAVITVGSMNPQGASSQTSLMGTVSHTLSGTFADGYNHHATRYNTAITKAVYAVDSYDGNSTSLCLVSDTLVTKIDGTQIEIGDLEEGDRLKGYSLPEYNEDVNLLDYSYEGDENASETEVIVKDVVFSFSERIYDINEGTIVGTSEHPMLVKRENQILFKTLGTILEGDSLIRHDGSEVEITSIEVNDEITEIVSLDVTSPDTYLANGFISHNKGGNSHSDLGAPGTPATLTYNINNSSEEMLNWTEGSESGTTGITAYDVQVGTTSGGSDVINFSEYSGTSLNLVNTTTDGVTYYARVRAIDHGLKSSFKTLTFTAGPV
tara:strand:+ start:26 stop:1330 length:1305 start_codon:yes stop_codon:yes gene_type:complete